MSGPCIVCSSLEWKLRLRLPRSMLWMMESGQGNGGRERTPCWERESPARGGRGGERTAWGDMASESSTEERTTMWGGKVWASKEHLGSSKKHLTGGHQPRG